MQALEQERPAGLGAVPWVMDRLLGPGGCPWDREQTHRSLVRHLLEEAYEVVESIEADDRDRLFEELGDLLLQPVFHAQMEAREGRWGIDDVAEALVEKLIRRHPHVFGDTSVNSAEEVLRNWDRIKQGEKVEWRSVLEGIPKSLPALLRAYQVSVRAARCGFEWPCEEAVLEKLDEEREELRRAVEENDVEQVEHEIGDLLFTLVNVARWRGIEPESSLRTMVDRFVDRFRAMERASEKPLGELSPQEWDDLWRRAKESVG